MRGERKAITEQAEQQGDDILWLDLRSYGSEDRLVGDLFKHRSFQNWLTGAHKLNIFLDSFDECQIAIKQLASLLADEFEKYHPQSARLILRIACRTADWPNLLEDTLYQLFGNASVKVYELAPLTRDDVRVAATDEGFDPDRFLEEVERREVGPLAAKPVTLRLLFGLYRNDSVLPTSQIELYERGCLKLAEESNPNYVQTKRTGDLTPAQRLAVASRIAAVMIFGQKSALWTAVDFAEHTRDDITTAELCTGVEIANNLPFEVNEAAIIETRNTGLFDSRGENRMGWAHQTYAEFLAARYLAELKMPKEQILNWLIHPEDAEGKLVPQLHETAAWLAGMRPELFHEIMQREPQVLLQSDVASADAASKEALVGELLRLYDEERDFDHDWSRASRYHKLDHPALADQLRPFIVNSEKNFLVRKSALEMIEACRVASLQNDLADLALDTSQQQDIRVYAARAIANLGDEETKLRLKPLVTGEAGDDPEHRLQSWVLSALWPAHLSVEDIFSLFDNPGLSRHFISHDLFDGLKVSDLPTALAWVEKQPTYQQMDYDKNRLANKLMWLAWENLDIPSVLKAFALVAISRLKRWDAIVNDRYTEMDDLFSVDPKPQRKFWEHWKGNEKKRRAVIEMIASLISKDDFSNSNLFSSSLQLNFGRDVVWMVERLQAEENDDQKLVWAYLVKYSFDWRDQDQKLAIITACQQNSLIVQVFSQEILAWHRSLSEPSEGAATEISKEQAEEASEVQSQPKRSPLEDAKSLLAEIENGNSEAWSKLVWVLRFNEDGSEGIEEFNPNLKAYPGWQNADAPMQTRITIAARKYLLERDAQTSEWLGTNKLCWPAYAGYNALRLLYEEDLAFLHSFDDQVWKNWAPIIVAYVMFGDVKAEERAIHKSLVEMAYCRASEEIIATILVEIDKDHAFVPERIKGCWDDRLGGALLNKAKELQSKGRNIADLLDELLARDTEGASEFAESLLTPPFPTDYFERQPIVTVADLLMKYSADAAWLFVWPLFQSDPVFGQELIEMQASLSRHNENNPSIPHRLTEAQAAELYIWMLRQYPPAEDPFITGPHSPSSRELVGQWRESIVNNLKNRGTAAACSAIERVASEFPNLKWIKAQLLEAQALYRRNSWRPPPPAEILKMAHELQRQMAIEAERRRREEVFRALWVLECGAEGSEELSDACGQGTAFMLADFGLVTCQHVLCQHVKAFRAENPAKKYEVEIFAEDVAVDLAILRIIGISDRPMLQARMQPVLNVSERITVAGFPKYRQGSSGVFDSGEVIGFTQKLGQPRKLVNVSIISGNSGGPVLDDKGLVVGVAVEGATEPSQSGNTEHGVIPIGILQRIQRSG